MNAYLLWHRHIFTMLAVILVSDFCCWNDSCTYSFWAFFSFFSEESSVKRSNCSGPSCFVLKEIFFHMCACQNCTTQQLRIFLKATLGTNFERCGLSWTCISRFKVNWTLQVMLAVLFGFYIFRYGYVSKCVHVFPLVSSWKSDNDWAIHSRCPNTCEDDVRMTHRSSNHK